ncbi:3-deoxy-7-phosphoheptulonate synthase class II [Cellulomonas palmilytica]|nr:3-deoxy-7-phosphoheptulonate synthase class II [Cellulomonas palmilytica]
MPDAAEAWRSRPIEQAVAWPDAGLARQQMEVLRGLPPLVFAGETRNLHDRLAQAAAGEAFVLIAGDCAESFDVLRADRIRDQLAIILQMSLILTHGSGMPVVKIGRMAGQFAKPRSSMVEETPDGVLPSFRGHLINSEFADSVSRTPDPRRLVQGYNYSASMLNLVRAFTTGGFASLSRVHAWNQDFVAHSPAGHRYELLAQDIDRAVRFMRACGLELEHERALQQTEFFTAHEALVLDYESALTRMDSITSRWYGCSAHLLWIGERTRQVDGAHVEFARGISNPIGVKVSASCTPEELVELCGRLDPQRTPGRLVLMARMGAERVEDALPGLVAAVRREGHPVVWMSDPMHGNTRTTDSGIKTRDFDTVITELLSFLTITHAEGVPPGGVHLELTPEDVTECTGGSWATSEDALTRDYRSLCDPRLNGTQALDLAFIAAEHLRSLGVSS